ncbi:hypothetical protein, partial [uncultured Porphyromonas sp.]|uniref:hypothetical protein n=1 Tax=uncultured Porphyromonas sp. TaxID=159274 RepID=UPI00258E2D65
LAESMTGGYQGTQNLRPLWSHLYGLVRPQGSMTYTVPISRWSSGFALDQGLAEWHPVGCTTSSLSGIRIVRPVR